MRGRSLALGVRIEFLDGAPSFDAVVDDVAQGRADIGISKLSQTYYRLIRVRFSEPYITLSHALLFERAAVSSGNYEPRQLLLEAQSVSMSIGTAIAVMPSRVKAFRRDILSVIVVLPFLSFDGLAAASLLPTLSKSLETASLTIFRVATGLTLIWIKPVGMSALGLGCVKTQKFEKRRELFSRD